MTTIAQRIAYLRSMRKLSQEDLGQLINTSQRQISYYENAKNEPTASVVKALAEALNTTSDFLLGLTDNVTRPTRTLDDLSNHEKVVVKAMREHDITKAIREMVAE